MTEGSCIQYVHSTFQKAYISYSLICTRMPHMPQTEWLSSRLLLKVEGSKQCHILKICSPVYLFPKADQYSAQSVTSSNLPPVTFRDYILKINLSANLTSIEAKLLLFDLMKSYLLKSKYHEKGKTCKIQQFESPYTHNFKIIFRHFWINIHRNISRIQRSLIF